MNGPARIPTSPEPVSDATLRRFVGYHLKRAFNVVRADLVRVLEPLGLRMITYSALAMIVDNPGVRPSRLAEALSVERANMVAILDELERMALIERRPDPRDRRAQALDATEAGRDLCARAVAADEASEAALMRNVRDADRDALIRVLGSIENAGRRSAP